MDNIQKTKKSHLSINITEESNFDFFAEYDKLGNLQKDIWRAALWWTKRFPLAFPSQSRIAKKVGCSREHVNRAFSKFKKFGWLSLGSRGPKKSKYLIIPLHLLQMDLVKREYFRRVEITSKITYSYSSARKNTGKDGKAKVKPLDIPNWLMLKTQFSHDSKLKLALLPERIYEEARYRWAKKTEKGFKANDPEKYFVQMAIKIAEKQEFPIKWAQYYAAKQT